MEEVQITEKEDSQFCTNSQSTLSSISFGKILRNKFKNNNQIQIHNCQSKNGQNSKKQNYFSLADVFEQYQHDPCSDYIVSCFNQNVDLVKLANKNYGQYIESIQEDTFLSKLKQTAQNSQKIKKIGSLLKRLQVQINSSNSIQNKNLNQNQIKNQETNKETFSFKKCIQIISEKQNKISHLNQSQINEISQLGLQSQLNYIGLQSKIKFPKQLSVIKEKPKAQIIENLKDKNNPQKNKYQVKFNKQQVNRNSQGMIKGLQFSNNIKKKKHHLKSQPLKKKTNISQSSLPLNCLITSQFKM